MVQFMNYCSHVDTPHTVYGIHTLGGGGPCDNSVQLRQGGDTHMLPSVEPNHLI